MDWQSSSVRWRVALVLFLTAVAVVDVWALSRIEIATSAEYRGSLHVSLSPSSRGWWRIAALQADSPLSRAAVAAGDEIRFDRPGDAQRLLERGEPIGVALRTRSATQHIVVRAAPDSVRPRDLVAIAIAVVASLLMLVGGALIGWLGANSLPLRNLAASLLSQTPHLAIPLLPGGELQSFLARIASIGIFATAYVCFMYFALEYARWPILGDRHGRLAYRAYLVAFLVQCLLLAAQRLAPESALGAVSLHGYGTGLALFSIASSFLVLLLGQWRATGVRRERLAWIVACLGAIYAAYLIENVALLADRESVSLVADIAAGLMICAGNAGLAYAVLRHRVLDFGFAVNRAMVYGATSLLLAGTFVLASQIVNGFIRFEGRKGHHLLDLMIGVGLALGARQAVKWVDPRVQRIFFRKWHVAAAKLAAFRIDAIHGKDPREIRSQFLEAVRDYSGAPSVGLYLAAPDGALARSESLGEHLPAALDATDPIVKALDSSTGAIEVALVNHSSGAALGLPMKVHGHLVGAVLLGPRVDDEPFRPDERKQLAATAQQVGLGLELARLRALELQVVSAQEIDQGLPHTATTGAG